MPVDCTCWGPNCVHLLSKCIIILINVKVMPHPDCGYPNQGHVCCVRTFVDLLVHVSSVKKGFINPEIVYFIMLVATVICCVVLFLLLFCCFLCFFCGLVVVFVVFL